MLKRLFFSPLNNENVPILFFESEQSEEAIDFTMMCVLDSEQNKEAIDFTKKRKSMRG